MRYGSLYSGIEAATVAWAPLGWTAAWFAETDPFCNALLDHHYPDVPNLGDVTDPGFIEKAGATAPIDMLVGGSPCQAFSVAGLRRSLDDDRGNLTLRFVEVADAIDPRFILWENVPGVLSTRDNAFGCFLAGLVGADTALVSPLERGRWTDAGMVVGPQRTAAWRVLDAQYFGLAQRRRRVFVLGVRAREGVDPGAVLFEPEGLRRDTPPGREAEAEVARSLTSSPGGSSAKEQQHTFVSGDDRVLNALTPPLAGTLDGCMGRSRGAGQNPAALTVAAPLAASMARSRGYSAGKDSFPHNIVVTQTASPITASPSIRYGRMAGKDPYPKNIVITKPILASGKRLNPETETLLYACQGSNVGEAGTSRAGGGNLTGGVPFTASDMAVRRLTPLECERLQGFPDGYTMIPHGNHTVRDFDEMFDYWRIIRAGLTEDGALRLAADSPRYRALGNSMAVPVVRWLGERIELVLEAMGAG